MSTFEEILPLIHRQGEKQEVGANFHLSLQEEEFVWFLEKGSVNFFAIEAIGGEAEGRRYFLAHILSPNFLFGVPKGIGHIAQKMEVITEGDSVLWKVPLQKLEPYLSANPLIIHEWINRFSNLFSHFLGRETDKYLLAPQEVSLKDGETISLKRAITQEEKLTVNWLQVIEGNVEFLGIPHFIIGPNHPPFPLRYHAFLKSKGPSVIRAMPTPKNCIEGLNGFYDIFFQFLVFKKELDEKEEREQFLKRDETEEKSMNDTLLEMAALINPIEVEKVYTGKVPLAQACQIIGEAMRHSFSIPDDLLESDSAKVLVDEIAKSSGVRYREVQLEGEWWKKDSGPLLAFWGPELRAVALLLGKMGNYQMIDPDTNEKKHVDSKLAGELSPDAYTFYLCFPDTLSKGKEILFFYLKHYSKDFSSLIFYSILVSLISLVPFYVIAYLFNRAIPEANLSLLTQITFALIIAVTSSSFFIFFRTLILVRIEGNASNFVQLAVWDRLLKLPLSFFRRYSAGNLILRTTAIDHIRYLLTGHAARIIVSAVFSIFYIIAMAMYAPSLTFIGLMLMGISLLMTGGCSYILARKYKKSLAIGRKLNAFLVQVISAVGKLRTVGAEKRAFAYWGKLFTKYKKVELSTFDLQNFMLVFNYLLPFLSFLFIFGFLMFKETSLSTGAYIAFNAAFVSFYIAIIELNKTALKMSPIYSLWDMAKVIIEEPYEEDAKKEKPGIITGEISVDDVSFKYDENGPLILKNISLKANPKEFIGIVGGSGSGKSTLIRLLLGFEKPTIGSVYYNELDLHSLDVQAVRKQLGVVLQAGGIISGSIFENIACGGIYEIDQIERAIDLAGFKEDLESFPMGLHTMLSTEGETLSGGQKQKLLIARALVRNPRLLIFDEATSALDNKSQALVSASLDNLDVTRIVIAHRLSTIKNADRIYVFSKGEVIQTGTFDSLSKEEGMFSEMLKRQGL